MNKKENFESITKKMNELIRREVRKKKSTWNVFFGAFVSDFVTPLYRNGFITIQVESIKINHVLEMSFRDMENNDWESHLGSGVTILNKLYYGIGLFLDESLNRWYSTADQEEFIELFLKRIKLITIANKTLVRKLQLRQNILNETTNNFKKKTNFTKNEDEKPMQSMSQNLDEKYIRQREQNVDSMLSKLFEKQSLKGNVISESSMCIKDTNIVLHSRFDEVYFVSSIDDIVNKINSFSSNGQSSDNLYFRGHGDRSWTLDPSIKRQGDDPYNRDKLFQHENDVYEQTIIQNPEEFTHLYHHLGILKKMQHYNIPTRLLDITKSLSAAIFFACEGKIDKDAEIIVFNPDVRKVKPFRSDNIAILSSLPVFNAEKKAEIYRLSTLNYTEEERNVPEFNDYELIKQLVHEVNAEKNFTANVKSTTLLQSFFVQPTLNNRRIISQQGAFILPSLNPDADWVSAEYHKEFGDDFYRKNRLVSNFGNDCVVHFIIKSKDKPHFMDQLKILGVKESTIYPEIEKTGDALKRKYLH